ncbi:unnamed protein product [Rhizopus microsporus]|uniref:Uncharacterized protein n=1 Tax=Rhizopus microsporus TaxID=58291 RepID=A0A1X0RMR3_RHIZD|nr:hypothetical protein BCV71DRAFT_68202 [Rhizopus microsporus]
MDHQENLNKHQPSSAEELDLLAPESTFESIDRSETENEWVDIIQAGDEISTELRTIGDDDLQEPDWGYEEDQQRVDTIVNTISDSITHDSNNDQSEDICLGSTIQQSLPGAFNSAEDNLRIIMFHKNSKSKMEYSSLDVAIFLLAAILNAL